MNKRKISILFCVGLLIGILLISFVLTKPQFNESAAGKTYYGLEDTLYSHNFTANLSIIEPDLSFSFIYINSSEHPNFSISDFSWIFWNDSSLGIMLINSTKDNETGFFNMSINVINSTGWGDTAPFYFQINATNDAPNFTNINTEYNLSQNQNFFDYINATDEEEHYPLTFNISFLSNNCTHASWSGRNNNENCSLFEFGFNLTNVSNVSALMNFTPAKNDVGIYWANISVSDYGENYTCPHAYCDNSTYRQNKTTFYSTIVKFNVFSALDINATGCQNKIFQENVSGTCQINITSKGETDNLNISSLAILRNYQANVSNKSWFFANISTITANFTSTIIINVTPQKTEIGNWTINFSVDDISSNENLTEQINVYINRSSSLNDAPDLASISNTNTSIDIEKVINLTVYDDDLLIPDKNDSAGGYNETTTFNYTILNQSDLSQSLSLSNFSITILNMPVVENGLLTNRTEAEIRFTANSSDVGNYTINITVNDSENSLDSEMFNLSILLNNFPIWNQTTYTFLHTVNSTLANTTQFGPINLTDGYVSDPDSDILSFTNDSNAFPGFNLSSNGIVDFTPWKRDVGYWSFNVTATDALGLQNITTFIFNISNINSDPLIETPISVTNASVDVNSNINASEDNYTIITLWINDEDFRVAASQKIYYNESLAVNLTIEGSNTNLFSFTKDSGFPTPGNNRSRYTATFTPNKTDVGNYNITINVSDIGNASDVLEFNLTVLATLHNPVLINLTNQTSGINRTLYYDINATDIEDGNEDSGNLTFSYNFLNGIDFINNNKSIFNTTSGVLNITFNDTQDGRYRINISVNDTDGSLDSGTFWTYVYGIPNITYPNSTETFNLQENVTSNLTFRGNHSVQDNLTYEFYINGILRNSSNSYGNDTNYTWSFRPNFTDETYGKFQNLTLIVYPNSSYLTNNSDFNFSQTWNLNITHTNSPVDFGGYIGDKQATYNQEITINLLQYFSDIDYSDSYYNQTINFTVTSNSTPSYITSSVSNWTLTLSSSIAVVEVLNITGDDSSTNATSNDFEVQFTTPTTISTPTPTSGGGGGGGGTTPVSLKIIIPDPVSAYQKDRIVVPLILYNNGKQTLSGIDLTSMVVKDNLVRDDIRISFDKSSFSSLAIGQKENVTLTIDVNTTQLGTFEITVNASVKNPKYYDWGKLYLTIKEGESLLERLLFVEEFIVENPECAELTEIVNEAKEYFKKGDFINTVLKINQAIDACKKAISQPARARIREKIENKLYYYLFIATLVSFFVGILYYFYKRIKLKKGSLKNLKSEKDILNKTLLVIGIGLIGLFAINAKITWFAISNVLSINQNKFNLIFIFIIGILGFLIFLNKKNIGKFVEIATNKICKKYSKNRIKGLIKKKVYTDLGDYIGKVGCVILGKNKIDSLKIKLDNKVKKKNKINFKGIIIRYQQVKSVGHILIIKESVLKLNKRNI